MDVLENEHDRESHRSAWLPRLAGGAAAVAVALAVVPTLFNGLAGPTEGGALPAPTPLDGATASPLPAKGSAAPQLRQPTVTNAHVLLATDNLSILDVDGGHTHTLFLPESYGSARPGGVLRVANVTVMLARPPSQAGLGLNSQAFVVQDNGVTSSLGTASQVLPATEDAVWLTERGYGGRTVRLMGIDGVERLSARPLPPDLRLVASGPSTLLLGAPFGEDPDRIVDWDPVTGDEKAVLANPGLVHDADTNRVLWQECQQCVLQSYERATGASTPLSALPEGWRLTSRASLSPDGRHWSGVVATAAAPDRRTIVMGHLPGSEYVDSISTHLDLPSIGRVGRPRTSWSESGWLFVSTGYSLWAVSPGPHQAFALDAPDHDSIAAW